MQYDIDGCGMIHNHIDYTYTTISDQIMAVTWDAMTLRLHADMVHNHIGYTYATMIWSDMAVTGKAMTWRGVVWYTIILAMLIVCYTISAAMSVEWYTVPLYQLCLCHGTQSRQ